MTQTARKPLFNMNVDLMHGPIFKSLVIFMLPIFVSNLFQQLYNTVDTMIVGNVLGDTALAAIGSCGSIYELLVGFGLGIGNGLAIVAARSYGAQDDDLLKKTVAGSLVIGLIASLCITLAGAVGLRPLLVLLDTPAEILEDAYRYIIVIDYGVIVMFAYNLCAGLLRAIGNSFMPLVFLILSSVSSIVSAGSVALQYGINGLGTLVIAGHTAARKMFMFTDMPLLSMASAGSTFVSQNCGAGQPDRVRKGMKEIYLYSVVVAVLAVLLMRAAAPWMVAFVSGSSEPVVLENGARYLLWNAPFYAVLGVLLSTRYALQSLGNKVLPLFSSVIELVGKIIFVLLLIPKFAYNAVILCEPIIWCFMAVYLVTVYLHDPFVFPKKK